MLSVSLVFNDAQENCKFYINGKLEETYTYSEGEIVLSAMKKLNDKDGINISVTYNRK